MTGSSAETITSTRLSYSISNRLRSFVDMRLLMREFFWDDLLVFYLNRSFIYLFCLFNSSIVILCWMMSLSTLTLRFSLRASFLASRTSFISCFALCSSSRVWRTRPINYLSTVFIFLISFCRFLIFCKLSSILTCSESSFFEVLFFDLDMRLS